MKRTDLALEVRESIEEDDQEVKGVVLEEKMAEDDKIKITKVWIRTKHGEQIMGKPIGTYMTMELSGKDGVTEIRKDCFRAMEKVVGTYLKKMIRRQIKDREAVILVAGLGNREATPDSLGPRVVGKLFIDRCLCAVAPGVMAQTGMETYDILSGIVEKVKPDLLLVVDALAARSTNRLMRTVQITDTGICPGAGIGNHRKALNKENIGIPVIAVGVPTVVDAETIVEDKMEHFLQEQGFSEKEITLFLNDISKGRAQEEGKKNVLSELFVTPKDIDETIEEIGQTIAGAINRVIMDCFQDTSSRATSEA